MTSDSWTVDGFPVGFQHLHDLSDFLARLSYRSLYLFDGSLVRYRGMPALLIDVKPYYINRRPSGCYCFGFKKLKY